MADLGRQEADCQQQAIAEARKALVCCSRVEGLLFGDSHEAAVHERAGGGALG
jgi:hypothetical protein